MQVEIMIAIVLLALVEYVQAQNCTNQPRTPQCRGNKDEGRGGSNCRAGRRFFFDESARSCKSMEYKGCGGNNNRFCRERDCQQACQEGGGGEGGGAPGGEGGGGQRECSNQPQSTNCRGGKDEGLSGSGCRAGKRFFFDSQDRQCKEMQYKGCGGNYNRYCKQQDCQQKCRR